MSIPSVVQLTVLLLVSVPIVIEDIRSLRIPDVWSLGGLVTAVAVAAAEGAVRSSWAPLAAATAGAAVGFGVFYLVCLAMPGKLGFGDAKYAAFLGACLGVPLWVAAVFLASISGLAAVAAGSFAGHIRAGTSLSRVCRRTPAARSGGVHHHRARKPGIRRLPFAPYLAASALLVGALSRVFPSLLDLLAL